ncbi:amino acid racemase [Brevibacillus humidisoli]|uniref:aspartate/glutamate racemase family protein n=1 Tax=Brevibacillus humidisoli TaxID=2895522 RepID=UPI001E5545FC|nr:amino acid racemase [Brevibacillus humidisoli]UFJ40887.1 amino acid racemase [Brevibacillus humidisoli]
MKRIGIVGGLSAESTALFYQSLTRLYIEQHGDTAYPEMVIFSVRFHDFYQAAKAGNWQECAAYIAAALHALERAGADFALISANMPHIVYDDVARQVSLPLLHIADAVAAEAKERGYKKIALLGTKATMNASFYPDRLAQHGMECLTPSDSQKDMVNQVLEDELFKGIIRETSREAYLQLCRELREEGAEAVILGCTEIPMLLNPENSPLPMLDSSLLLAQAALQKALV